MFIILNPEQAAAFSAAFNPRATRIATPIALTNGTFAIGADLRTDPEPFAAALATIPDDAPVITREELQALLPTPEE